MHNNLGVGTLPRAYRTAVGLSVEESGVERLGETLTPVLDVWGRDEFAFLRGEKLLAAVIASPAVAAQFSFVGFNNTTRDVIMTIEEVYLDSAGGGFFGAIFSGAALIVAAPFVQFGYARDLRLVPGPLFNLVAGSVPIVNGANAVLPFTLINKLANQSRTNTETIVPPGWCFVVYGSTLNSLLTTAVVYRERKVFPGELGP